MGNEAAWKIVATPADRWNLAVFFLFRDLTFKTRKEQRQLHRARTALGLIPPTKTLLGDKKGNVPRAYDRESHNVFTVTAEMAEFVVGCVDRIEVTPAPEVGGAKQGLNAATLAGLEPILQQLEDRAIAKEEVDRYPDAPAWDEVTEEDWEVSLTPTVQQPDKLVDVFVDCLRAAGGDFEKFGKLFTAEAQPALAGRKAGRLADESASNAPS